VWEKWPTFEWVKFIFHVEYGIFRTYHVFTIIYVSSR
jgi:hypothetical protein